MSFDVPHNPLMEAAVAYARRGWQVFPLRAGTKGVDANGRSAHLLANGHNGASDDPGTVEAWWRRWPDANIGLNLAASGLLAIDPDLYKPDCGWAAFIRGREMPATLVQTSPRGGKHFIFRADPVSGFAGTLCPGVDIKHKGYILLEPSTYQGAAYRFETDDEPAPVPDWVPLKGATKSSTHGQTAPDWIDRLDFNAAGPSRANTAEVEELLSWLDPDAEGYNAWIEVLQALHDHFAGGDDGLALAEAWSSRGALCKPGEVASKWRGFRAGGGVTLKAIAARAGNAGADLSEIARRHWGGRTRNGTSAELREDEPDLSQDALALDLGERSWNMNARHVALWGKWLFWTGSHWQRDETLDHLTRARTYLRARGRELSEWAERKSVSLEGNKDNAGARKVRAWARDQAKILGSNATVAAVSSLARANPGTAATHDAFDANRFLVGSPGGTIDLRSGALRSASREDMISRRLAVAPADPGTRPDRWLRFLEEVFEGDEDIIAFMQRAAGYAMTGSVDEHKLLFLHGAGRNGKSVFLNTLLELWGDYGRRVAATTFLNAQTERHPTDIAGLHGARLAIASELPRGKTWDEAMIKDLTGGDRMTARFMRQDFFDFDPQMTLMIAGNTQPSFRGVDEAIRSRVVLVPFTKIIPAEKRDRDLQAKLRAEGQAILRWCIDGALAWQDRGLDVPPTIAAASESYFDEEDTVGQFLQDETLLDPHAFTSSGNLILRFNMWAEAQGLGSWTQRTLIKELRQRGFEESRTNSHRGIRGLRLG